MECKQSEEMMSDYIDGALELGEVVEYERHLASCLSCRALRDDLLQIIHFSRHLPEYEPPGDLWWSIQEQLSDKPEGLVARSIAGWRRLYYRAPLGMTAAAALIFVVIAAFTVVFSLYNRSDEQFPPANLASTVPQPGIPQVRQDLQNATVSTSLEEMERHINRLKVSIDQKRARWDPELQDTFDRNIVYIDQSLAECKYALAKDPSDSITQELMLNAYKEKTRLLEGFSDF